MIIIIFRLLKLRFTSTLITLLMTLQLAACNTEDFLSAIAPGIGSGSTTEVVNNQALSWVAPAEREDNSALSLSAIAGYKVYYGTTQGQYPNSVTVNDGTATGYTFNDLPVGTYYLVVTTIDTEGRESLYSSEVTIVI